MAESNATQVILTDDGIKIIKAQNTADNAAGGVTNLNDPNLMSVIEKQNNVVQFAGLTSQYNVLVQNAKDDGIDTTAVTTAYNNLNTIMADVLADPDHASDVDRTTYKKYQDAYNEELAKLQSALQNNANNKFTSAANATSQAASTASQAFVQAQSAVNYANTAIANDKVTSQAVTDLKGGSTLTIQQLQNGIATKIESSDFKSYQKQAADMFVSEVSFNNLTISNRNLALGTATPITFVGENIANQAQVGYQFSSVIPLGTVVTVAFDITSSTGVGTYMMQFDGNDSGSSWQTISNGSLVNGTKHISVNLTTAGNHLHFYPRLDNATGTVTISNFIISESSKEVSWTPAPEDTQSQITQLSGDINLKVNTKGLIDQINIQAGNTLISSSGQLTLSGKNIYFDTANPVMIPSANIGTVLVNKNLQTADISANTFTTNNGTFTVDKYGAVVASNLTIRGVTNLIYNAALLGGNGSYIPGWILNGEPYYSGDESFEGVPAIAWNGDATGRWDNYANSKLQPVTQTGIPYSASVKFRDYGSASGMLYTFSIGFFSDNGVGDRVGYVDHVYTANGSDSGIQTFTINGAIAPSNAKYVAVYINAHGGKGHVAFSSPMLTQTSQATGYQPDTGNVVSAGIIDGSTINGGTINMQTDGLINSPYNGIQQSADQFYHPWKLNTGQLTIGQGYISSVSSGTRSINGVPKQFDSVQGTLSASYLKFTNNYGSRTYIDADMFTYSNQTNDTAMVKIDADGVGINAGTMNAPALTISNGYLDASSSSSYGMFGAITLGYSAHIINSDDSLFFESGHGSGNPGIDIWAKSFQSMSSRLSTKRQVRLLDDEHSNSLLLGADTATFQYNQDTNADNPNEGVIIDNVNPVKQYNLPDELITRDGKSPTDLMSFIARLISQNKYQAHLIEDLQIRLRKVEIKNE
ncbi:phage tail protein [Lactobacillus sp. LMY-20]|nr:phage tail protein [Lactobacillus sp. LMY-20]